MDAMEDFTLRILMVASIISIIVEVATATPDHINTAWIDGFAIMTVVIISSGITTLNDY